MKDNLNNSLKKHLPYFIIATAALFIAARSSFAPHMLKAQPVYDQAVFTHMGWIIKKGFVPYLDAWDNKGPLLYLINFLGLFINADYGIFLMQWLAVFSCGVFLYKTAGLFAGCTVSLFSALYCIIAMRGVYALGNSVEEYSLPFVAAAIYILSKCMLQERTLKISQIIAVGACSSACVLLRINLVAPILAFCCVIFLHNIVTKKFARAGRLILFYLVGFTCFAAPFVIWLAAKGALSSCLSAAYSLNQSMNVFGVWEKLHNAKIMSDYLSGSGANILLAAYVICTPIFLFIKNEALSKYKLYAGSVFLAIVLNIPANMITGYAFAHYYLTFIPILLFPAFCCAYAVSGIFGLAFEESKAFFAIKKSAPQFVVIALSAILLFVTWTDIQKNIETIFESRRTNQVLDELERLVRDNTSDGDMIQLYNDMQYSAIYALTDRQSASRFFYTPFWESFTDDFVKEAAKEVNGDIMRNRPRLLIVWYQNELFNEGLGGFVRENYDIVDFPVANFTVYKLR